MDYNHKILLQNSANVILKLIQLITFIQKCFDKMLLF